MSRAEMPRVCFDCKKHLDPVMDGTRCFHCAASPWYCWDCARKHFTPVMPNELHECPVHAYYAKYAMFEKPPQDCCCKVRELELQLSEVQAQVKKEHSDYLQEHHAHYSVELLRVEAEQKLANALAIHGLVRDERDRLEAQVKESNRFNDEVKAALVDLYAAFVEVCKTSTGTFNEFQRNAVARAKPFLDCLRHGYYSKYQTGEAPCSCPTTKANEEPKTGQEKHTEKRNDEQARREIPCPQCERHHHPAGPCR